MATKKKSETEGEKVGKTGAEQRAEASQRLSQLEQERNEHNARVAPGGAQLPPPLKGSNPPRPEAPKE